MLEHGKIIFDGDTERAIAVYMDRSVGENQVDIDLTKVPHTISKEHADIFMERIRLVDKATATYESGEELLLEIKARVKRPAKNAALRLTLRTDTDAGLGTAWSDDIDFTNIQDGYVNFTFSMDMSMIARGIFYVSIGLYTTDEIGQRLIIDHVTRAFKIEIVGSPVWYTSAYGHINFPKLEII